MYTNILVPVDFSPASEQVVEQAAKLAALHQAKLWLVHVAAPDPEFVGYDVGPQYIRDARADELREEHRKLQEWMQRYENEVTITALLIQGEAEELILKEATSIGADLIMLASNEHSALYNLFVGSLSNYLIRNSSIPLLVIPFRES